MLIVSFYSQMEKLFIYEAKSVICDVLHLSLVFWMWRSSELLNYTFSKLCFSSKPSTLQGYYVGKKHKNLFYSGGFDATVESEDGVRRKKTQDVAPCSSAADLIPISCHCSKINFWKSDYTTKWPGKILCRVAFCSGFAWWIKTTGTLLTSENRMCKKMWWGYNYNQRHIMKWLDFFPPCSDSQLRHWMKNYSRLRKDAAWETIKSSPAFQSKPTLSKNC